MPQTLLQAPQNVVGNTIMTSLGEHVRSSSSYSRGMGDGTPVSHCCAALSRHTPSSPLSACAWSQVAAAESQGKSVVLVNPVLKDIPSHSGIMGVRCVV